MTAEHRIRLFLLWGIVAALTLALLLILTVGDEPRQTSVQPSPAGVIPRTAERDDPFTSSLEMSPGSSAVPLMPGAIGGESNSIPPHWKKSAKSDTNWTIIGIVDTRTGEPVPTLDVRVDDGTSRLDLRTDSDGRTTTPLLASECSISISDLGTQLLTLRPRSGDTLDRSLSTIHIPIGPTYFLGMAPPAVAQLTDWRCRLIEIHEERTLHNNLRVSDDTLTLYEPTLGRRPERVWSWQPIRDSGPMWIRYSTIEYEPDPHFRPHLQLRNNTTGEALVSGVTTTVGIHSQIALGRMTLLGTVSGRILGVSAEAVAEAHVLLVDAKTNRGTPTVWEQLMPDSTGVFAFTDVTTGPKQLMIYANDCEWTSRAIEVCPGVNDLGLIQLAKKPCSVRVQLASAEHCPRTEDERTLFMLRPAALHEYVPRWIKYFTIDNVLTGEETVVFDHLPYGAYEFQAVHIGTTLSWDPRPVLLDAPESVAKLSCLGAVPSEIHRFIVVANDDNKPCDHFVVSFDPGSPQIGSMLAGRGTEWRFPRGTPLRWTVWLDGYKPVSGDERAFVGEAGMKEARVVLERGWGCRLFVRAGNPRDGWTEGGNWGGFSYPGACTLLASLGGAPLAGVRCVIDAQEVGVSDDSGQINIAVNERPTWIRVVTPGWRVTYLDRLLHSGGCMRYVLCLEPESSLLNVERVNLNVPR